MAQGHTLIWNKTSSVFDFQGSPFLQKRLAIFLSDPGKVDTPSREEQLLSMR